MNNKTNIEEDIKILNELKENKALFSGGWGNILTDEEKQAIENILADRERLEKENLKLETEIAENIYFGSMPIEKMKQLQTKANKYDSLIEKIKEEIKNNEWSTERYDCTTSDYKQSQAIGVWNTLQKIKQELLDIEK